ncbi:MAG: cytochrome c [bacterium]|nr:cytochrome c [bacterium]
MNYAKNTKLGIKLALGLTVALLASCRGGTSEKPPVHPVLDMDFQQKVKTQSANAFFANGRGMRMPITDVNGQVAVVARGSLPDAKLTNRDAAGGFVTSNPVPISEAVLARGQRQFDIYCAVCHGYSGQGGHKVHGNGLVGRRWPVLIPNFHFEPDKGEVENRVAMMPDGEYFEVISNGKNTMPAYGARLSPEDRWAIVHYVRVLQSLSK